MLYAIQSPISWRAINDASDLMPGEALGNAPPDPGFPGYLQDIIAAVSTWLDSVPIARGYDSIVSCISYVGDADTIFNAEALAARSWRSAVYRTLYASQAQTAALPPDQWPTSEYVIANLPQPTAYTWEPITP